MNKNGFPTPQNLAAEARKALERLRKKPSKEHFIDMVRRGVINSKGQVTRLIGGSGEPEPDYENWTPPDAEKDGEARK